MKIALRTYEVGLPCLQEGRQYRWEGRRKLRLLGKCWYVTEVMHN